MTEQSKTSPQGEKEYDIVPAPPTELVHSKTALVPPFSQEEEKGGGLAKKLLGILAKAISEADEEAARERVERLRAAYPNASVDELVNMLIRKKCGETGMVGATTSSAALIPGLGTFVALTVGVAADIGATFKLQADLVLEIAAAYEKRLSEAEKHNAVMIVTGLSAGGNQLLGKGGEKVAAKIIERYTEKSLVRAIPLIGIIASAGANVLSTYVMGQRAKRYFRLGADAVGDWSDYVQVSVERVVGLLRQEKEPKPKHLPDPNERQE
jgi:hypothetical protein